MNWDAFWSAMVFLGGTTGMTLLLLSWGTKFARWIDASPSLIVFWLLIGFMIDASLLCGWLS